MDYINTTSMGLKAPVFRLFAYNTATSTRFSDLSHYFTFMKKACLLAITHLVGIWVLAQNTIGLPEILNYSKQQYGAGTQNWDIKKDRNGILYFANNEGLLTFDGTHWRLHPLPNKSIVRSLAIGQDQRIYVGGQEELGYFAADARGKLVYTSLNSLLPRDEESFADVWDLVIYDNAVFFRSNRKIFRYFQDRMTTYKSIDWRFMGVSNGMLIAQEYEQGLLTYKNGVWTPFIAKSSLPGDYRIGSITGLGKDSALLTTQNAAYLLSGGVITPFTGGIIPEIAAQKVYATARIDAHQVLLATNLKGCYVVDHKGNLVQRLTKQDGIQNNNILSVLVDGEKNIWLGLDNGIDFVAFGTAIRRIYPDQQNKYAGYTSLLHDGHLYVGTAAGLFRAAISQAGDLSFVQSSFEPVLNTKGQVWTLSQINGKLLMGHNEGAFVIENGKASPLDPTSGFWTFQPMNNVLPSSRILAGTYNGVNFYDYENGRFTNPSIHAHFESARFVANENGHLWIAHPYKGIFRVDFDSAQSPRARKYEDRTKILSSNHNYLFQLNSGVVLSTEKGIYELNPSKNEFEPSDFFTGLFGKARPSYLREDRYGNIWFVSNKSLGVVDMEGPKPVLRYITELTNKITANGYEYIDPVDKNNIFIAGEEGFFHINYEAYRKEKPSFSTLITAVRALNRSDSLVYGGFPGTVGAAERGNTISAGWNTFRFEYAAALYGTNHVEYSFQLKGFDKSWSEWTSKTEKEYTNLPPGTYTFEVKARYSPGKESPVSSYTFTILPAWYQTYWAYLVYFVLVALGVYGLYKRQQKRFLRQQQKHEKEQQQLQYLHQLEMDKAEKELVKLKNEKLEAEIQHKNTELASSAMHLVQKGELLARIREELVRINKEPAKDKSPEEVKKIIKILGEEDRMDEDWEQFTVHFDQVHSNFLRTLKKTYPALTSNELKLCAYLRMNMSTKEIAKLMNISVRGVEISRYRLRKKLGLQTSESIYEALMQVDAGRGAAQEAKGSV
ncbi:MAG TPA: triple tyrosine motif-containing protein [Flavisolibacter sp.]